MKTRDPNGSSMTVPKLVEQPFPRWELTGLTGSTHVEWKKERGFSEIQLRGLFKTLHLGFLPLDQCRLAEESQRSFIQSFSGLGERQ